MNQSISFRRIVCGSPLGISIVALLFVLVSATTLVAQDKASDKKNVQKPELGAASTLFRGIVRDADGKPVAGAIIESMSRPSQPSFRVTANAKGAFVHRMQAVDHVGIPIRVTSPDGTQSSFISGNSYELSNAKPFKIVVAPHQKTTVRVLGQDDRPIEGATVVLTANFVELAQAETNGLGETTLMYPADAKVDWIAARKFKQGFDYYENYDSFPTQERLDVPKEVQLKLDSYVSVEVTSLDSKKKPIQGIKLMPWSITKKGKLSYVTMSESFSLVSDRSGKCSFDWIPKDLNRPVTFLGHSEDYFTPDIPMYDSAKPEITSLTMNLLRLCKVTGRATYPDGTPAVGVRLQGEGRGDTNHYFRDYTSTKQDGTYELKIYPDQDTMISVVEDELAASSVSDILLAEGTDRKNVDFELIAGTQITGLIATGDKKSPVEGQTATLFQIGDNRAELVRWSKTNQEGRYQFRVGPGNYRLILASEEFAVAVDDEKELTFDKNLARLPRGTLAGAVLDEAGKPVAGAEVQGESINSPGHAGLKTETDADGRFKTERWNDDMSLMAIHTKSNQFGYTRVAADDQTAEVRLRPGAVVSGTVVDSSKTPIANTPVMLLVRDPNVKGGRGIRRISSTNASGQFSFRSVPTNASHRIQVYDRTNNTSQSKEFKVDKAGETKLEPIEMPAAD